MLKRCLLGLTVIMALSGCGGSTSSSTTTSSIAPSATAKAAGPDINGLCDARTALRRTIYAADNHTKPAATLALELKVEAENFDQVQATYRASGATGTATADALATLSQDLRTYMADLNAGQTPPVGADEERLAGDLGTIPNDC